MLCLTLLVLLSMIGCSVLDGIASTMQQATHTPEPTEEPAETASESAAEEEAILPTYTHLGEDLTLEEYETAYSEYFDGMILMEKLEFTALGADPMTAFEEAAGH